MEEVKVYGVFDTQAGYLPAEGVVTAVTVHFPKIGITREYSNREFGKILYGSREAAVAASEEKECTRYEQSREEREESIFISK